MPCKYSKLQNDKNKGVKCEDAHTDADHKKWPNGTGEYLVWCTKCTTPNLCAGQLKENQVKGLDEKKGA